jgi:hypothetical protein
VISSGLSAVIMSASSGRDWWQSTNRSIPYSPSSKGILIRGMIGNLFPIDDSIITSFKPMKTLKILSSLSKKYTDFQKIYTGFHVKDEKLFYNNLQVVEKKHIDETLSHLYENDNNILSKGVVNFYKYIRQFFINITRKECQEFLNKQSNYQINKQPKNRITKPIIAKYPSQQW